MTTRPVTLPRPYYAPVQFLRQYFYLCMSLLIAVVVVYGFTGRMANLIDGSSQRCLGASCG